MLKFKDFSFTLTKHLQLSNVSQLECVFNVSSGCDFYSYSHVCFDCCFNVSFSDSAPLEPCKQLMELWSELQRLVN